MTVLETKNLGVTIGGNDVVSDLNISLEAGRVLGICGESGAGKSMAAMAIAGLLPDDADTARADHPCWSPSRSM